MAKDTDKAADAGANVEPDIEHLIYDQDIASREGVSLDYMARVRIAFLLGQNQSMIAQTQFADAKAGALLAFIGLVATRGPGAVVEISAITPALVIQIALHGLALICAIIVLYPRYANHNLRRQMMLQDRFSWPALAGVGCTADDFAGFMRGAQLSQLVVSVARSNHALSAILLRKFTWLRAAFVIAIFDVALMALRVALNGAFGV